MLRVILDRIIGDAQRSIIEARAGSRSGKRAKTDPPSNRNARLPKASNPLFPNSARCERVRMYGRIREQEHPRQSAQEVEAIEILNVMVTDFPFESE